jgi:nitrate reductase gamma subunit
MAGAAVNTAGMAAIVAAARNTPNRVLRTPAAATTTSSWWRGLALLLVVLAAGITTSLPEGTSNRCRCFEAPRFQAASGKWA